jgi:hypothetical protein
MEYKQVSYISNSKLGEIKRILAGEPAELQIKEQTLELGRQLHLAALQPELYSFEADPFAWQVKNMVESLMKNVVFRSLRNNPLAKFEHERYWTCKTTGVKCKGKFDIKLFSKLADLKTTSAQSQEEFTASLRGYDANRQSAFYLDGDDGDEFMFIGVQKKWPFKTFTHPVPLTDKWITDGREEYIFLIRQAIGMGIIKPGGGTNAVPAPPADDDDFFKAGIIY